MKTPNVLLVAVGLLTAEAASFAQQPTTADLERMSRTDALALAPKWLARGTPQQRAWAAYWISRDRLEQRIPDLLDALGTYEASSEASSSDWNDDDAALLEMLDALIQLNADVSPDSAGALYTKFPAPALVLLARSKDAATSVLLGIFDGAQSWQVMSWLAVADLLAASPPPGFAARLLKEISVHARVQVLSPGQGAPGAGIAGDCAESSGEGPSRDWPPVGAYHLAAHPEPGSELLAAGEDPVYMVRTLTKDYSRGAHSSSYCADWDWMRVAPGTLSRDLIGQLLGMKKERFALQLEPSLSITWSSGKTYRSAATSFVQKQQGILHGTEAGLEARGLLTDSEAASIQVPFEVEVLDVRVNKTPLPDLVFAEPSITVTYQALEAQRAN